jgi:hypothetical protein
VNRTVGASLMAVAAIGSLAVLAFAPGVGCGVAYEVDINKQAKERSLGRHRIEAISAYVQTRKKIAAKARMRKAKADAEKRKKTITPAQQSAFRAGVVIGAWNRYIGAPFKQSNGKLSENRARIARLSLKGLQPRAQALAESAKAAGLNDLSASASSLAAGIPKLAPGLRKDRIDPKVYASLRETVLKIRRQAGEANLKVLDRVPPDFIPKQ